MKRFRLFRGNSGELLKQIPTNSVDALVTDPPYGLKFMDSAWDASVPAAAVMRECLRVLKPGGHLLAFSSTRTQHRMAVAIEDGGFEIRDIIFWVYATGYPKALDVSKAIDALDAKDEQQARRLRFTAWVRSQGVTAKQIDTATGTKMGGHYVSAKSQPAIMTREHLEQCRHLFADIPAWVKAHANQRSVESENLANRKVVGIRRSHDLKTDRPVPIAAQKKQTTTHKEIEITEAFTPEAAAWAGWKTAIKPACEPITVARKRPRNGIAETVLEFGTGALNVEDLRAKHGGWPTNVWHDNSIEVCHQLKDAARIFYVPKPSRSERDQGLEQINDHPTVKPIQLMRDLIRLVTPPGGLVLDPYNGSGTTGCAAILEGFRFLGFEEDKNHMGKARRRIRHAAAKVSNGGRQLELF
jgi:site-specific DNA-methyltransferase (adenine-specific)